MNDEHTPLLTTTTQSPMETGPRREMNLKTLGIVGAVILAALLLLGFAAARSMPGDALYGAKTAMEDFNGGLQLGEENRVSYQADLMRVRLEEVKDLVSRNAADADTWNAFVARVEQHRDALVKSTASANLDTKAKLAALSDFAGVADAVEQVSETDTRFAPYSDRLEDVRSVAVRAYRDTADLYASEAGKDEVFSFIKDKLGEVSNELKDPNVSQDAVNDADVYVSRVEPAIQSGDLGKAIAAIEEAFRFIRVDLYAGDILKKAAPEKTKNSAATTTATSNIKTATTSKTTVPNPAGTFLFSQ
jgi:hypothetical protein